MLDEHEKFRFKSVRPGDEDAFFEVNWAPDDPETNQCKMVKISVGDKEAMIKKEYLYAALFAMGAPTEQQKMIPQKLTKVRWYETTVGVRATKDIRKGEMMNFPIKISLPSVQEEVIGEVKRDFAKKSGLIVPKT